MSPSAFVNLVLNALTVSMVVLGWSLCVSTSSSVCLSMLPCSVGFSATMREVWAHVREQVVRATRATTTHGGTIHAWMVGKTLCLARYRRLSGNAL